MPIYELRLFLRSTFLNKFVISNYYIGAFILSGHRLVDLSRTLLLEYVRSESCVPPVVDFGSYTC